MKSIYFGNRDLGQLTEAEKQTHYENICEAAGLDPALNLLRYRMMDDGSGTGKQHLVLYATKPATDAIRGVQGISDLEQTGIYDPHCLHRDHQGAEQGRPHAHGARRG